MSVTLVIMYEFERNNYSLFLFWNRTKYSASFQLLTVSSRGLWNNPANAMKSSFLKGFSISTRRAITTEFRTYRCPTLLFHTFIYLYTQKPFKSNVTYLFIYFNSVHLTWVEIHRIKEKSKLLLTYHIKGVDTISIYCMYCTGIKAVSNRINLYNACVTL